MDTTNNSSKNFSQQNDTRGANIKSEESQVDHIYKDLIEKLTPILSARRLPDVPHTPEYERQVSLLKKIREKFFINKNSEIRHSQLVEDVYRIFQEIDEDKKTDWKRHFKTELDELASSIKDKEIDLNHECSSYWNLTRVRINKTSFDYGSCIKVYISLPTTEVSHVYMTIMKELMQKASTGFYGKISRHQRAETSCFWVMRPEYEIIRDLVRQNNFNLVRAIPFIAYTDDNLGISKDFPISHNELISKLIVYYLSNLKADADIRVEDLYIPLIDIFQGDEDRYDDYWIDTNNIFELTVLLETLYVQTGLSKIGDDHIFLNDDPKLWHKIKWGR